MRKLLLLVAMIVSLSASDFMCDDSLARYKKYSKLLEMAVEREDVRDIVRANKMSINYVEKVIVNCEGVYDIEHFNEMRKHHIKISKIWKGV